MKNNVYSKKKYIFTNICNLASFIVFSLATFYVPFANEGKEVMQQVATLIMLLTVIESSVINAYLFIRQLELSELRQLHPRIYYGNGLMSGIFCVALSFYLMNGGTGIFQRLGVISVTITTILLLIYIAGVVVIYMKDRPFFNQFKNKL